MTSTSYLGWDPYTIVGTIRYTGTVKTDSIDRYVEKNMYQILIHRQKVMIQDLHSMHRKVMHRVLM